MTEWWHAYWPWILPLAWLVVIELVFLVRRQPTLSERATRGARNWPALPYVAIAIIVVLVAHFWFGLWEAAPRP